MLRVSTAGRLAVLLFTGCLSTYAGAAAQRTFVSSGGVDNPLCSLASPCRGFAAALLATLPNGEVIVLDSAGYGVVTISQAVSIISPPGVYAGISVFTGDGITVSAGPGDKVVLRGLTINGQGGTNGIHVTSGAETYIEDCTVANLTQYGVLIEGASAVHMARIVARGNGSRGVQVQPSAAIFVQSTLADSLLTSNGGAGYAANNLIAGSTIHAAATRVTATDNGGSGFLASSSLGTVILTVADSVATENLANGVFVSGTNATAIVSGSSLVRNFGADFAQAASGVLRSAGNNAVTGRGVADITGTLTANPLK